MGLLLNKCMFRASAGGTGTWTVSSAITGYLTPANAGAVNATVYSYSAESDDKTEWEIGTGTYTSSGTTFSRTPLKSSNSDAAVNFTAAPRVALTPPLVADFVGKQTLWVPRAAMKQRATNGAAPGSVEMSTNKNMFETLDFDATTQEFAQFSIRMPKGWNEGTVTFIPVWSHAATATNFGVAWGLAAVAISNDDAGDVAFGTAQTSVDTGGTTNDIYQGPESSAITIAGTPAEGDWVLFQVNRTVSDAGDTMAIDARLHGLVLFITNNNMVDD